MFITVADFDSSRWGVYAGGNLCDVSVSRLILLLEEFSKLLPHLKKCRVFLARLENA